MTDDLHKPTHEDFIDMARTIWGEARGEGYDGKLAVAHVIRNRWKSGKWFGAGTISATCRKPYQFSCWNMSDPNRPKMMGLTLSDPALADCMYFALAAIQKYLPDNTSGSTHYLRWDLPIKPPWVDPAKSVGRVGAHEFYKGIA